MKKKHWLIYVVIFLTIINLGYFISLKYFHLDIFVKNKIVSYLEKKSNLKINYQNISINDKELTVSDLKIAGKNFTLKAIQLDFQYHFWRLIFHNKKKPILENIHFYMPQLDLNFKKTGGKSSKKFPNLGKYFSKLQILNARINLNYQDGENYYRENFKDVLLDIVNDENTKINFSGKTGKKGEFELYSILSNSKPDSVFFKIDDYETNRRKNSYIDKLTLSAEASYHNEKYNVTVKNLNANFKKHSLKIRDEKFTGNSSQIKFDLNKLLVDNQKIKIKGKIFHLKQKPKIYIVYSVNDLNVEKYYGKIRSKIRFTGTIKGDFKNPKIDGKIKSDSLMYGKYKLNDVVLKFKYAEKKVKFDLKKSYFMGNKIYGRGEYKDKKYRVFVNCDSFYFAENKLKLHSDVKAKITDKNGFILNMTLSKISVNYENIRLENFSSTINLRNKILMAKIFDADKSVTISLSKDLDSKEENAIVKFKRYDLSMLTKNLSRFKNFQMPSLSGKVTYNKKKNNILTTEMDLRIYDTEYGRFDGRFKGVYIKDFVHKKNYVRLNSHSAKFNYEPFSINFMAGGDFDKFKTYYFRINNDINVKANVEIEPKLSYHINVKGENLRIRDLSRYFVKNYTAREIGGKLNFDVTYSSEKSSPLQGKIKVSNFFYDLSQAYNSQLKFVSENGKIKIHNFEISTLKKTICKINGFFVPKTKQYVADINFVKNKFSKILPNTVFDGNVFGKINLNGKGENYNISADFKSLNSKIHNTKIDTLNIVFSQTNKEFSLEKMEISNPYFVIQGNGKIGYNVFTNEMFPSKDILSLKAKGDFLKFLSSEINGLNSGKSTSFANLDLMINENGFFVKNGKFEVHKGVATVQNQTENIRKFELKSYFKDNDFHLDYCKFYVGQGWFKIHNKIFNNEDDFRIGEINFGQYFFKTSKSGLLIYVNGYMPNKSLINIKLTGKDSKYSTIQGPFDNIKIRSVVEFSNGGAIYPPYTKNILKMLMQNDGEKKSKDEYDSNELPLDLDLVLRFNDNIKYVTYPLNISIDPNSYLHITYKNGHFHVSDASITSEKGKLEMFGTNFEAQEVKVLMNPYMKKPIIYGSFTKKTGDGSLIILDISAVDKGFDKGKRTFGNLQMHLSSDNPNDSSPERILAKLRYNKSLDELSNTERKNIYQDEAIDWAGVGISNYLIDPLISPIENYVRKLLDLDTFYLKTDIFKNIFYQNFDNINTENDSKVSFISNLGLNYFLNDLSINAGKYVYRDVFLDYELSFQKSNNLDNKAQLDLYHRFVARIDLPWKIKLSYKYYLNPKGEKNSQELMINRSFHF